MRIVPILFNTEMVRALLAGQKSVTRRVVSPQPPEGVKEMYPATRRGVTVWRSPGKAVWVEITPPYRPGDILYVRETWAVHPCFDCLPLSIPCRRTSAGTGCYIYRADGLCGITPCGTCVAPHLWRPSIHMPKEAARLFLRITDVRVERLQDISDKDILREGTPDSGSPEANRGYFADDLWDETVKKADLPLYGWAANPWVWVIEFVRCERPEEV